MANDSGVLLEVLISIFFFGWLNPFALFSKPFGPLFYSFDAFVVHTYQ